MTTREQQRKTPVLADSERARRAPAPAAVGLVAAIYIHFLIFAQFGFLQGIRAAGHPQEQVHRVLGAMALAGILASFGAAALLRRGAARRVGAAGLALSAAAGMLGSWAFSAATPGLPLLTAIAVLIGSGLAAATVATAILLRRFTGGHRVGLHVGIGTGLAYLICNVPAVFNASPATSGWIGAAAALVGLAAVAAPDAPGRVSPAEHYRTFAAIPGVALATVGFLALVWFDSAAFARVQQDAAARALFWSGSGRLWAIGASHAVAALVAGAWIDRGGLRAVLASAFLMIAAGHLAFAARVGAPWAAPLYAAGVSCYSTALAGFAALAPAAPGLPPAWRAAWVYSVAGWVGSAAGVGLVEQTGRVPAWALPLAAVVLLPTVLRLRVPA